MADDPTRDDEVDDSSKARQLKNYLLHKRYTD
jgi:hypothetical protein